MKALKTISSIAVVICFTIQVNAQIIPRPKIPKGIKNKTKVKIEKPNPQLMNQDLNYYQIEYNSKNNKKCYNTYTTLNFVDDNGQGFVGYSNSLIEFKRNGMLLNRMPFTGNGSTRATAQTNYLDVAIHPKSDLHASIDKNNILISGYSGLGNRVFTLQNVKIIRSKTNILITGSVKFRGASFGISISILQGDCLI